MGMADRKLEEEYKPWKIGAITGKVRASLSKSLMNVKMPLREKRSAKEMLTR